MNELRDASAYLELIEEAKGEGADLIATLLTHVGHNKPDRLLSIHKGTSAVGREAFSAVGFPEIGPTDASIREVLSRAVRLAADYGHVQLSRSISDFVAATWPDLDSSEAEAHDFRPASDDILAAAGEVDDAEVRELASQVDHGNYAVSDQHVTAKTRGSAQRVFAERVKKNYGSKCALTGIATRDFLVASHIVPWSDDESIRLDPANGICLSTFVDRAFDTGYLLIHEDYTVHVVWDRVGSDDFLRNALAPFDGQSLTVPSTSPPTPEFLRRRLLGGS